jgi:uncharacterized protein
MNPFEQQEQQSWMVSSSVETVSRERAFIRTTYMWMFGGLLITALASLAVLASPAMKQAIFGTPLMWVLVIAELGMVFFLSMRIQKMAPATAAITFLIYSALNGLTLSAIFFVYTSSSIMQAFVTAAGTFGAMSLYGLITKRDLTSWGSFFFMGLIGIILASVVNLFLRSDGLSFVISVLGVFIFIGLTAYDTQKLKAYARAANGPSVTNFAVIGALALYLDFINLFLMLLRLFGGRRN